METAPPPHDSAAAAGAIETPDADAGPWVRGAALATGLLVALGPLELRDGFEVGGLHVSAPELFAALAVACCGLAVAERWRRGVKLPMPRGPAAWGLAGLAAWGALHVASTAWAEADALHTFKFGLRVLGGVALAVAAWALADSPRWRRALAYGLLAALAVVTVLGLAERGFGRAFEPVLLQFRGEPTWMLGEQRLSTVFSHANSCAAFFELAAPLLVVGVAWPGRPPWLRLLLALWLATVAVLMSLTYSRAGLLSAVVGVMALAWAARGVGSVRRGLQVTAIGFAVVVVGAYAANPDMRARIGLTERSYRASWRPLDACLGHAGSTITVRAVLRNRGEWSLSDRHAPGLAVSALLTENGRWISRRWDVTPLPDMPPGSEAIVPLRVELPGRSGAYVLAVDAERDGVLQLSALGNPMLWLSCVSVPVGRNLDDCRSQTGTTAPLSTGDLVGRRQLELERRHHWRAALLLWERRPWLGWGADRYRLHYREYVPFEGWDDRARAHSVLAETAADLGLLGLALVAIWSGALVAAAARTVRRRSGLRPVALAALAGLAGFAVHSQVDYFLAYTQLSVILWPLVGTLLRLSDLPATEEDHARA